MSLTTADWHTRYSQQAQWTKDLRAYLYAQVGLPDAEKILDLGCGTGALLGELDAQSQAAIVGVDIRYDYLELAQINQGVHLSQGDAHHLPYPQGCFDITLCHFTLLWVNQPSEVISEMARVTRSGGAVMALAEPDYGGRIDYPRQLEQLGHWQSESLERQGANPNMGRLLAGMFNRTGLQDVETGVLGGQWTGESDDEAWEAEWLVLEADFAQLIKDPACASLDVPDQETLRDLKDLDKTARARAERVLFVPTFYALGWVLR
jgi:ubiquinone/menaquinone biosynthesis C-methylase UbiE